MIDGRDIRVRTDRFGDEWVVDKDGKDVIVDGQRIPPPRKTSKPGEFTTYDTSGGRCGLCGSLTCRGGCFK